MNNINLNNIYDTLCFSGGGTSCISFIGVLKYLVDNNYLDISLIKNFVGTSGGAIIAFLLSINYSINYIYDFILSFNFKTLENNNKLDNLFKNNGFNTGIKFNYLFSQFLYNKLNINDITFQELFNLTNNKLLIIGTNYSKGCEEIFSYEATPNMSVIIALRISMSIPILFTPVFYNSNYYIDGALVNNFPFNHCNKLTTLGLFINNQYNETNNIDNIIILLKRSIEIILNNKNNINYYNNIIIINKVITELVNYNLSLDDKNNLLNYGIEIATKFINKFNYDNFYFKNKYVQTDINENDINENNINDINEHDINENDINENNINDIDENDINENNINDINEHDINENDLNENNINENDINENDINEHDINENNIND